MSKKRLFQVFDEMNVNDEANKTAKLGCCYDIVDARTAKGGGHVTMGVPAEAITRMFLGEVQPILLLLDKKEYDRLKDLPVQPETSEQLQKQIEQEAAKYESATQHEGLGPAIYIDGAEKYASKWQAEKELRERYEKALREIAMQKTCAETEADEDIPIGSDGKRMGDIEVGYDCCIETAREALTPKTSNDEQ